MDEAIPQGYDSTADTLKHIRRVSELLSFAASELLVRGVHHDRSKLVEPEKSVFDEFTPKLKGTTYGSEEYRGYLDQMRSAIEHHNKMNRHHPEHFSNGVAGMNLFDLLEMFLDWKAASERHADGDIRRSIEINAGRFRIHPQLVSILFNTVGCLELEHNFKYAPPKGQWGV